MNEAYEYCSSCGEVTIWIDIDFDGIRCCSVCYVSEDDDEEYLEDWEACFGSGVIFSRCLACKLRMENQNDPAEKQNDPDEC